MSATAAKVRLVRCPKCSVILPELADIPVYKCGECNAVLKAKKRKEDGESVTSKAREHSPALKDESEQHSEIEDLDSSSPKVKLSSTEAYNQVESEDCHRKQCENKRMSNEISSSSGEISCQKKESSSEAGENRKAVHDDGGYSDSGSASPDSQVFSGESSPDSTAHRPHGEMLSQMNNSFSNRQPETSANNLSHDSNHLKSRDVVQIAEPNNHNFTSDKDTDQAKFSGRLRDVSKSSATRNSHVYDGSISSCDDWDDRVSDRHPYLYKKPSFESQRVAEFINNEGLPTKEDFRLNQKMDINVKEQNEARKFSSMSLNEKHGPAAVRDEILKPIRYDVLAQARQQLNFHGYEGFHQASLFKGLESDKFLSKEHFHQNHNSADYDHAGPSNYQHKEFLHSSSLYSPEKLKYDEYNQMELLRKVDELRDQLNRSYSHQRKASEKFLARCAQQEKQWPFHQENLQHFNTLQPPGALRPRKSMTHRCGCSKMSFSGLGTNYMHNTNCSDLHGYHEDWQCLRHEGGLYRPRPCYMCSDPYSSSSSPQRQVHSNIPFRGCKRQPCNHMLRDIDNEAEKCHKERHQTLKRHYRPVAGGAPFIICYNCFKLLHVPADFLRTSKRCHRLQCGSCSKVLTFSLHKRIHVVPYSPKSVVPTAASEVDNSHDTTSTRCSSHAHDCPNGDPMSYSEDYGLSTCKSCSTESEPAFPSPAFPSLQIKTVDKMQPSSTYSKLTEEKKKKSLLRQLSNKHKSSVKVHKKLYVGSSSNVANLSSGTEIGPQTGSPLHRLLGYSSPSQMINGSGAAMHSSN